jgi:3-deoxy-manno-octulosonate cytidylyltransferase (CMP-KDO synthetase)
MKTVIIIPARYASTRYPGKPLVELTLPDGSRKSLIELSWGRPVVLAVWMRSMSQRMTPAFRCRAGFGADVIMTSDTCRNGTERCAEAVANAGLDADLIVNLQGDAPLTPHWFVEDLMAAMKPMRRRKWPRLCCALDRLTYGHFTTDRKQTGWGAPRRF